MVRPVNICIRTTCSFFFYLKLTPLPNSSSTLSFILVIPFTLNNRFISIDFVYPTFTSQC